MARGNNRTLPSNTGAILNTISGDLRASVLVLNPNDGVLYVVIDGQASPTTWDFVVPSQSYAALPGPWQSVGLWYVDQSGAGRSGNVTVYESDNRLDVPIYQAVGIARLAQVSSVDLSEGSKPGNPGSGLLRMWADTFDFLHLLNSVGTDATVIDTLTALGGVLTGALPSPGLAAGAALANLKAAGVIDFRVLDLHAKDIYADRGDATGAFFAGSDGTKYLYWNGSTWVLSPQPSASQVIAGGSIVASLLAGGIVSPDKLNPSYFRTVLGSNTAVAAAGTWTSILSYTLPASGVWIIDASLEWQAQSAGVYGAQITGASAGLLAGAEYQATTFQYHTLHMLCVANISSQVINLSALTPTAGYSVIVNALSANNAVTYLQGWRIG